MRWKFLILSVLLFAWRTNTMAQTPVLYELGLKGSEGRLAKDSVITVTDSLYADGSYSAKRQSYSSRNRIILRIDPSVHKTLPPAFTATAQVKIDYTTPSGNNSVTRNLSLRYKADSTYTNSFAYEFDNGTSVTVTVLNLSVDAAAGTWSSLELVNRLEALPVYTFDCTNDVLASIGFESLPMNTSNDAIMASWPVKIGADAYDVEWTYIDSAAMAGGYYGTVGSPLPARIFDNNSSRVTVTGNSYEVPLLYDGRGHLFVRARPVQLLADGTRREAQWGEATARFEFAGHENSLNWQATTSFAEEGKRKSVLDYFDGTLRSRQTVTKDNETQNTLVAEKIYDYQGRPVIEVLPAPTLSTTIGYTRAFNQGLNSAAYDAGSFDDLAGSSDCARTADSMLTASGAANYYSPLNPLKDQGMHRFIPDAKGYPFIQVEYEPDQTGRISAQSGVGKDFQLKTGHETKYYYSSAGQEELNALFGTEVGLAKHYFKNMVRDANGQYSISYTDMAGKTIATALSGTLPAGSGLDTLKSSSKRMLTEKMSDARSAVVKDLTMETQKELLVSMAGIYHFQYSLSPEVLSLADCASEQICYDCLYDLQISINGSCTDPAGEAFAFDTTYRNFTLGVYDTACNTVNNAFNISFSKYLQPGSYQVTKQLKVNRQALAYYRDTVYLRNNTCSTIDQLVTQQLAILAGIDACQATCQACTDSLGSFAQFWTSYRVRSGVTTAEDSTALYPYALTAYNEAKNNCNELCKGHEDSANLRRSMLLDMTPSSGQYANPDNIIDNKNIFYSLYNENGSTADVPAAYTTVTGYKDAAGNPALVYDERAGQLVSPAQLTPEMFANKFQFSWAEALLPLHPEYPKLVAYQALAASHEWDVRAGSTDTYAEALEKGYLNPVGTSGANYTRFNGTPGSIDRDPLATLSGGLYATPLKNRLEKYMAVGSPSTDMNLWSLATMMVKCTGINKTNACYVSYQGMASSFPAADTCTGDLNAAWKIFRQLYLQVKRDLVNQQLATISGVPTPAALTALGYTSYFTTANDMLAVSGETFPHDQSSANSYAAANNNALRSFYASNCEAYASQWMEQLKGCYYSQADFDIILPRLVSVCQAGADVSHPFGASTVRPDTVTSYRSFEQVLRAYNLEKGYPETSECHPFLITTPGPYEAPRVLANTIVPATPDTCTCNKISSLYAAFQADPKGAGTFSQYLLAVYQTSIADSTLALLRTACTTNGAGCSTFDTPVTLPALFQCNIGSVCLDCGRMAALNKEFNTLYPDRKPVADSLAGSISQQAVNSLYEQFMNYRLGFDKTTGEYLSFASGCGISMANVCADNSKLVDSFLLQRFPVAWTQHTQEGQNFTDPHIFFNNGVLRLPDSIRAKLGTWYNSVNLVMPGSLCRGASYTSELRVRYNSNQQLWGDMMYLGDQNHNYIFARYSTVFRVDTTWYDPGVYLVSVSNNHPGGGYFLNTYTRLSDDPDFFIDWRQVRLKVAADTIAIYLDNVLAVKVARDNSALGAELNATLGYRGRYWETDYVKYYNENNALVYFEDFGNPDRLAGPRPDALCSNNVPSCETAFTTWFNQRRGTSYSFAQIDSVYRSVCGYTPTICTVRSPYDQYSLATVADSFILRGNTVSWSQATQEGPVYTDPHVFFINGVLRLPDSIRARGGTWYNGAGASFPGNVCLGNSFSIELRNRYAGPLLSGDSWYMIDGVHGYTFGRYLGTFTVGGKQYGAGVYLTLVAKQSTYFLQDTCILISADTGWIADWHTLKFNVTADTIYLYADNDLKGVIPRDHSALSSLNQVGMGYRGPYWETDNLKMYNAQGVLIYNEDFSDPGRLAQVVPYAICSNDSSGCQSAFTSYFNQQFGSSYSYAQVDSLYRMLTGHSAPVCTLPPALPGDDSDSTYSYPDNHLCGRVSSIFTDARVLDSISNCSDNNFFAESKATELYQHRRDSLNAVFDSLYRAKCLNAYKLENFTVTHEVREYHFTLYYYDQAGNLVKTIPPEGVQARFSTGFSDSVDLARLAGTTLTPAHTLTTQYRYNSLNQVVSQWTPDGGGSRFWYDRLGRLVASQNARQYGASATEAGRKYSYTQYDALGRITEVGEIGNAGSTAVSQSLTRNASNWAGWLTAAAALRSDITQTVYDVAYPGFSAGEQPLVQRHLRNRVSYTTVTAGSNPAPFNAASFYSYDIHGNVDTLVQDYGSSTTGVANIMNTNGNRWKKIVYAYDLVSGKVNQVGYNPGRIDQFFHRYRYDAENRLKSVETSADGRQWEEDARYRYYLHGPLARVVLGQDQVQGLDYAYTLQGWLKGINATANYNGVHDMGGDGRTGQTNQWVGRDVIGLTLGYFTTDYQPITTGANPFPQHSHRLPAGEYRPLYNGNISSMAVKIEPLSSAQLYNYRYDQLNRLTGTDMYTGLGVTTNQWGALSNYNGYRERYAYDGNGNILKLLRNGYAGKTDMDSLSYEYNRDAAGRLVNNQLMRIRDQVAAGQYNTDIDDQPAGNYRYDATGNLVKDSQASISNIDWNVYGKIRQINRTNGNYTRYTYDAAGNRISKAERNWQNNLVYTWYVRDAAGNVLSVYTGTGTGSTINAGLTRNEVHLYGSSRLGMYNRNVDVTSELPTTDTVSVQRGQKFFEITNHLGNVMVVVTDKRLGVDNNSDGVVDYYNADIASTMDYYSFGMQMPGRLVNSAAYRYGFNGKENDNEVKGTGNQQDYGMRIYDPRLGRFLSVDPLTKSYPHYTPYSFAGNKPISFTDRDGEEESLASQMNRLDDALLSNKISKEEYQQRVHNLGVGGIVSAAVAADIYLTKGKVSQFLFYAQFADAFQHNRASTKEGRIAQDRESWNIVLSAGLGFGVSKIAGNLVQAFRGPAKEEIKYLFRGTSEGYEGNAALQKLSITPTSSDPVVSTLFGIASEKHGKGVIQVALPGNLQGVEYSSNVLGSLEKEIALGLKPAEFAQKSSMTISVDQSRKILEGMGISLPKTVTQETLSEAIRTTPRLNSSQIDEYYNKMTKVTQ